MPLHPSWWDIILRLALTLAAGAAIGANREASGQAAGLRTTMLVSLAAAVAMIQMNLLLPVGGKTSASFSVMDVMRLPLGILSGMGFIGAGAILWRGELVLGVTTAATLWTVTVIGLCFGGGQLVLGIAGTVLAAAILWLLKEMDRRLTHVQRAVLRVTAQGGDGAAALRPGLPARYQCTLVDLIERDDQTLAIHEVKWHGRYNDDPPAEEIAKLRARPQVQSVAWLATTKRA